MDLQNAGKRPVIAQWSEMPRWDYKSARAALFSYRHPTFVPLGQYADEATELVDPRNEPDKEWPIYGVNNESGVFLNKWQNGSEFNSLYKRIRKDYFFHNPTRANVGSLGRVPDVPPDAITSPEYQVWKPRDALLPAFADILIKTNFFLDQVECHRVGGVKERLFVQNLFEIPVPVPSLSIQQTIVSHWEAAQASAQLIEEATLRLEQHSFEELRTVLGLKPISASRPKILIAQWSDFERWGHELVWRKKSGASSFAYPVKQLKEVCKTGSGGTPSRKHKEYYGGQIPWIKTTEVRNAVITDTEEKLTELGIASSSARLYPKGSIVIAMYGQGATRGRTAKLGLPAATNQACLVLTDIDAALDADFLWYYLMVSYEEMRGLASGNNQPNLSADLLGSFPVPIPPMTEQQDFKAIFEAAQRQLASQKEERERILSLAKKEVENMILGAPMVESY